MIEVDDLVKWFGRRALALDRVSFTVHDRDVFGFLGPNGAGKTTTIRILGTVLTPSGGTVRIDGHDVSRKSLFAKERIGLVPEDVAFYPHLTAPQHLLYYAALHKVPRALARSRVEELLGRLGLEEALEMKVRNFSHGMRRRLALAQGLLHDPDILLLDEPSNGLDPEGSRFLRDLIQTLNKRGKTIFISSHLLNEVEQLCNRIGIINRGRMVAVDTIEGLAERLEGAKTILHVIADGVTEEALRAIAAVPGVELVRRASAGLEVTIGGDTETVPPEVNRVLVQAGARVHELQMSRRSLEDLFLSFMTMRG